MSTTSLRWDAHFLRLSLEHARMSKDPSTKVGAIIVGPDREIRATGFNGLPRGIADMPERLNDRETKLDLVVPCSTRRGSACPPRAARSTCRPPMPERR